MGRWNAGAGELTHRSATSRGDDMASMPIPLSDLPVPAAAMLFIAVVDQESVFGGDLGSEVLGHWVSCALIWY